MVTFKPRMPKKGKGASRLSPEEARKAVRETMSTDSSATPTSSKKNTVSAPKNTKRLHEPLQPARNFSGRTVAFLMVLFLAAVLLTPSLRLFLSQQKELNDAQAEIEAAQERNEELSTQLDRWDDPAYVQQQARERFNMVMPGERKYVVSRGREETLDEKATDAPGATTPADTGWADDLWNSLIASSQH